MPGGLVESPIPGHRLQPYDTSPPAIDLSESALDIVAHAGQDLPTRYVAIRNSGGGVLGTVTADVVYNASIGWLTVTPTGSRNEQSLANTIHTDAVSPGTYTATVRVSCNNAGNAPVEYQVDLEVRTPFSVSLLEPVSGEQWLVGTRHHIRWTTSELDDVNIYYRAGSGDWEFVARMLDDGEQWGSYLWLTPDTPAAVCTVRVEGYMNEALDTSDTFSIVSITDVDGDDMDDSWEVAQFGDLSYDGDGDDDADDLTNVEEMRWSTDPRNADSDADLMRDGWEVSYGLDPLADSASMDADGDGHSNVAEYLAASDPTDPASVPALEDEGGGDGDACGSARGMGAEAASMLILGCCLVVVARRRDSERMLQYRPTHPFNSD
jgi:hypothetical protein